ncbi:MAG: hypothetical protein ACRDTD_12395 [Pseudonocardiaceae bacterium]
MPAALQAALQPLVGVRCSLSAAMRARLAAFLGLVDELTAGAHFFSADHEAQARLARPGLPQRVLHLPHPRFALATLPTAPVVAGSVGLLGRLRGYKRTVGFARAYLQAAGAQARIVVAQEESKGCISWRRPSRWPGRPSRGSPTL